MVDDIRGRYVRRNYSLPTHQVRPAAPPPPPPAVKKAKKPKKKKLILSIFIVLLLASGAAGGWLYFRSSPSPVPQAITQKVDFPVYYPDPKKLPAGYTLNLGSFNADNGQTVLYTVSYGDNQKLIFTVQKKPSSDELNNFNKQYVPINRQILTIIGTATVGAIGKQTVVSLPTDDSDSWIIMTGPSKIYATTDLAQVLKAMTKSD